MERFVGWGAGKFPSSPRFLVWLLVFVRLVAAAQQNATLAWDQSPDPGVTGYNIYYGGASQTYTNQVNAGNTTNVTISGLVAGATYYFAATAYDASGDESAPSDELVYTTPNGPLITPIANQIVAQNNSTAVLPFLISEAYTPATTLTVTAASANPQLVPLANIVLTGSDSNQTVQVTPAQDQTGTTLITISVSDTNGNTTSTSFQLTVESLPTILSQPVSLVLNAGATAIFSVGATNEGPLVYQWLLNGVPLTDGGPVLGSTQSTLTVTGVLGASAGNYSVVVSNVAGAVASSPATLTVSDPVLTSQPTGLTRNAGAAASFTINVAGTAPWRYQWLKNGTPLSDGGNVSGSASATLNLNPVTGADAASYSVAVSNVIGGVTSSSATLVVNDPVITGQPVGLTRNAGATASFTVTAAGAAPLTFQWLKNGAPLSDGGNVSGSATPTLTLSSLTRVETASYSVLVTSAYGSATSFGAALAVNDPVITSQPANLLRTVGSGAGFTVGVAGTAPLSYQWYKDGVPLSDGTNVTGSATANLSLTAVAFSDAGGYSLTIGNTFGSVSSSTAVLTVQSATPPNVLVVYTNGSGTLTPNYDHQALTIGRAYSMTAKPAPGQMFTGWTGGTNSAAALLNFLMRSNLVLQANFAPLLVSTNGNGTVTPNAKTALNLISGTPCSFTAAPAPGQMFTGWTGSTNSASATVRLVLSPTLVLQANFVPLLVGTNGNGTITPNVKTAPNLAVGAAYTLTANPAAGQVFAGWTGSVNSSAPTLHVTLSPNLVLQANFIPSPYPAKSGSYNGLFYEADAVRINSAGSISVQATSRGTYTGKIQLQGSTYPLSGSLGLQGQATQVISRGLNPPLTVQFGLGSDQIYGSISTSNWLASVLGDRALFNTLTNPAPQAGAYTMLLWRTGGTSAAQGHSYGTLTVSRAGVVSLAGALADGSKITQSAPLSKGGLWPLFVPLYSGKGLLSSWVYFANSAQTDFSGVLSWIMQTNATAKYYPGGFTNQFAVYGSSYTPPNTTNRVLNLSSAQLSFSGGNLAENFSDSVVLGANNQVTDLSSNRLTMLFSTATGTFTGNVVEPMTGKLWPFSGAVLQKLNLGYGFLAGTNASSQVYVLP